MPGPLIVPPHSASFLPRKEAECGARLAEVSTKSREALSDNDLRAESSQGTF